MAENPAKWINPYKPPTLEEFKKVFEHELSDESIGWASYRLLLWTLIERQYTDDVIEQCFLCLDVARQIEWIERECHFFEKYMTGDYESADFVERCMHKPVKWLENVLDGWPRLILKDVNSYIAGFVDPSRSKDDNKPPHVPVNDIIGSLKKQYFEIVKPERERAQLERETLERDNYRLQSECNALARDKARLLADKDRLKKNLESALERESNAMECTSTSSQAAAIEAKATALKQTETAPESTSEAPAKTKEKPPITVKLSKVPNSFHPELCAKAKILYGRLLILTSFGKKECVYTNHTAQKELHFNPRSTDRYFKALRDAKLLTTTNTSYHPNAQSINVRMVELSIEAMPPKRAKSYPNNHPN